MHQSPTILKLGPYAVMYAIAEHVVDSYQRVSGLLETDIDAIQSHVFSPTEPTDVEPLYLLKREIAEVCHAVSPSTAAMGSVDTDHGDSSRSRSAGTCGRFSNVTCRQRSASSATT